MEVDRAEMGAEGQGVQPSRPQMEWVSYGRRRLLTAGAIRLHPQGPHRLPYGGCRQKGGGLRAAPSPYRAGRAGALAAFPLPEPQRSREFSQAS